MKHTTHSLAMRDAALASALGVLAQPGADFGVEFSSDTSHGSDFGIEFGDDDDDWGAEAPAAGMQQAAALANPKHPASPFHPANHQRMITMWNKQHKAATHTAKRQALIEPNAGSSMKVERYTFSVGSTNVTLGTAASLNSGNGLSNSPSVNFRPERFTCNSPGPGFVTLTAIQVANVNGLVGAQEDSWTFNPNSVGIYMSLPTLTPSNKATITGASTTFVPPGYTLGLTFPFIASFTGWATMVA